MSATEYVIRIRFDSISVRPNRTDLGDQIVTDALKAYIGYQEIINWEIVGGCWHYDYERCCENCDPDV